MYICRTKICFFVVNVFYFVILVEKTLHLVELRVKRILTLLI